MTNPTISNSVSHSSSIMRQGLNKSNITTKNSPYLKQEIINVNNTPSLVYSPFSNEEAMAQIIGLNAQKILRGKEVMPIIVDTEERKKELKSELNTLVAEGNSTLLSKVIKISRHEYPAAQSKEDVNAFANQFEKQGIKNNPDYKTDLLFMALSCAARPRNFKIASLEKTAILPSLDGAKNKLVIIGHGSAGVDLLASTRHRHETRTFNQLASTLKEKGLPKNFTDIKLTSCYSGDNHITTGSEIPPGEEVSGAPAQILADELGMLGYYDIGVYGYRGKAATMPDINGHKMQSQASSPDADSEIISDRSSSHRYRFTPKIMLSHL